MAKQSANASSFLYVMSHMYDGNGKLVPRCSMRFRFRFIDIFATVRLNCRYVNTLTHARIQLLKMHSLKLPFKTDNKTTTLITHSHLCRPALLTPTVWRISSMTHYISHVACVTSYSFILNGFVNIPVISLYCPQVP